MTSASVFDPREMVKVPAIGNRSISTEMTRAIIFFSGCATPSAGKSTRLSHQAKQDAMLTIRKRDASGQAVRGAEHQPHVAVSEEGGVLRCAFSGVWTT